MRSTGLLAALLHRVRARPQVALVVSIAIASITVRALLDSRFGSTALLYIGVPFFVTLFLLQIKPSRQPDNENWTRKYARGFRYVFIVLFATSIVLYEGFLCVLLFIPIYFLVAAIAMAVEGVWRAVRHKPGGTARASVLPVLVLAASLEGTHASLSFDRYNEVSAARVVEATPAELLANIAEPFDLDEDRAWLLQLFPMPDSIVAERLAPGAVHEVHWIYHRWLVANTHEGRMLLEITDVADDGVTTTILEDTSYISHYLTLHGTRIHLEAIDPAATRVTLTVRFDRKLDPAWYFGPLERYAVKKMAELLIEEVVVRWEGMKRWRNTRITGSARRRAPVPSTARCAGRPSSRSGFPRCTQARRSVPPSSSRGPRSRSSS